MKTTIATIYLVLLIFSFLIFATLWHFQMQSHYFICHGKGIFEDFIPPFVKRGSDDAYLKPAQVVYTVWSLFAGLTLILPAAVTWLLMGLHNRALNKTWM